MNTIFVSYEIAKKLKEKGYKESCLAWYIEDNNNYSKLTPKLKQEFGNFNSEKYFIDRGYDPNKYFSAPIHQQVIDWLREKYGLYIFSHPIIDRTGNNTPKMRFLPCIAKLFPDDFDDGFTSDNVTFTNSEALEKAIEQALKLI